MPKRKQGRAAVEAAVRQEAGAGAGGGEEEGALAGAPLQCAADATAAAARVLVLDALIKPLERELAELLPPLRAYMLQEGCGVLLTGGGSVALRTSQVARLDQALIPPAILAAARVPATQHALVRSPDLAAIRQGVLGALGAAGPPPKRAKREEEAPPSQE